MIRFNYLRCSRKLGRSLLELDKSQALRLLLVVEMLFLLGTAITIQRDYQDSWILEGLELPFAAFMITLSIYVFIENKITWILLFVLISRSVILLLPNLKYVWFQGVAIDQNAHYRLTQDIYNEGYVPSGRYYSDTPLMHISFVIFSMMPGIPLLDSYKFWPVMAWSLYPLVIYLIVKDFGLHNNSFLCKIAVLISGIPVKPETTYLVMGTLFGPLLLFLILWQIMKFIQMKDIRNYIISIILSFTLVATHSYSSVILALTLFTVYFLIQYIPLISKIIHKDFVKLQLGSFMATLILVIAIIVAWLSDKATQIFGVMVEKMTAYIGRVFGIVEISREAIPNRFFELSIINDLRIILVYHGADIVIMLFMLVGIIVMIKTIARKLRFNIMFLTLCVVSLGGFLVGGLVLRIGENWYDRIIRILLIFSPIFSSASFVYVGKNLHQTKVMIFAILLVITLATVELYAYQPLVPPANVLSKDLPSNEPLDYINKINSIYQRDVISSAERLIPEHMRIASDRVTRNQIRGLTSYTFSSSSLAYYYPLSELLQNKTIERECNYFLIHLPGISGVFSEEAEIRTMSLVVKSLYNSSIVYTNGESYIIIK